MALVGFHIAATVNGHPEMIWATFEHVRNAPDLPKPVNQMGPDEVVSDKGWTFYQANTRFRDCNINSAGAGALKLNERQQTLSPVTQVCRIIPSGGGSANNVGNIKSMNDSVHSQLKDVFNNYFEVGAIWFNASNALKPNCTFQPGSLECRGPARHAAADRLDPAVEHHGRDLHAGAERAEQLLRLPQHRAGHVAEHHGAVIAGPQRRHQPRADQQIFRRRIQGEAEAIDADRSGARGAMIMSDTVFRVHPAIGIGRVGDSQEFYIAPVTAAGTIGPSGLMGGLPIKPGTEDTPITADDFRDKPGNVKRQAARFRVYAYPAGASGKYPVGRRHAGDDRQHRRRQEGRGHRLDRASRQQEAEQLFDRQPGRPVSRHGGVRKACAARAAQRPATRARATRTIRCGCANCSSIPARAPSRHPPARRP